MDWALGVDRIRYVLAVMLALSLPPALLYWFIVHPFVGFWRRVGARRTLWVLGVIYVGLIAGLYPFRDALVGRDLGTSGVLALCALPLLVAGGIISRRRRKYLSFRTLAGVPELAPQAEGPGLLQEGIYGRIRHPRYVEFTLALAGWALFVNHVGIYWMYAASIALLYAIVLIEERELRQRFGQAYVDYSARVPRFLPRLGS